MFVPLQSLLSGKDDIREEDSNGGGAHDDIRKGVGLYTAVEPSKQMFFNSSLIPALNSLNMNVNEGSNAG